MERIELYKNLDFVSCWYFLASEYQNLSRAEFAFVSTNSICQGRQVQLLWTNIFSAGKEIRFAYKPFKWKNNAKANAGVTCVIVGVGLLSKGNKFIFDDKEKYSVERISGYLTIIYVEPIPPVKTPISALQSMSFGGLPNDAGN